MKYRQDIDGMRAIAVAVIVLFHFGVEELAGGYIGVDVFFVISGYLITRIILEDLKSGIFSFHSFYLRRVRRLGPSLLATLTVTLGAGYYLLSPTHFEELGLSTQAAVLSLSNILFWTQSGYFDTEAVYKPLLHTWSLAVEEQFYLVWPLTLLLLVRFANRSRQFLFLLGISCVSLLASEAMLDRDPSGAFFLPIFRIYEFAFGAALAMSDRTARPGAAANLISVVGIALIAGAAMTFSEGQRFPGIAAIIPCLGAALLIFSGPPAFANRVLALPVICYVGRISYSLYLVHWPILVYYAYYYGAPRTLVDTVILTALAVSLGSIFYHFIETPFRQKNSSGFKISGKFLGTSVLSCALAIVLIGGEIDENKGYPGRLSPEMQGLLDDIDAGKEARRKLVREDPCHFTSKRENISTERSTDCVPGSDDNTIVIVGDSHAADIWVGLSSEFPENNFIRFTGAGCDFGRGNSDKKHCAVLELQATEWLANNIGGIKAIIYSQRAASAMKGDPSKGVSGLSPNHDALEELKNRLEALAAFGAPVYFWGPRPEFHPEIKVVINTLPTIDDVRAHYDALDFEVFSGLDDELQKKFHNSNVKYLSTISTYCNPSCPILDSQDRPLITDYAHWTLLGARHAVTRVVPAINELGNIIYH